MQRRQERRLLAAEQGEREVVGMEVQHIELVGAAIDQLHHAHIDRNPVDDGWVQAQRLLTHRLQLGRGDRITAGEQRDIVTHGNQFFSQRVYNALCATVQLGRHRLEEGRDLSDTHEYGPGSSMSSTVTSVALLTLDFAQEPRISRSRYRKGMWRKIGGFRAEIELLVE